MNIKLAISAIAIAIATPAGAQTAAPASDVTRVTDCQKQTGAPHLVKTDGTPVRLVLPISGNGVIDFHFKMGGGFARAGRDTAVIAVCRVGVVTDDKGPVLTGGHPTPLMSTVYRTRVRDGRATVMIALPSTGTTDVSVVVKGETYYGRLVSGPNPEVVFGEKTPEVEWVDSGTAPSPVPPK
ncbi:MAG: hypothetical protein KBE09_01870 [Candidatus Pacebacteria bacterium]|nr:hypothetical protein [Candidatus Paceibacterota bacterium]